MSSGIAGRTNYAQWDKLSTQLVKETDEELEREKEANAAALGLDGKYAVSQAQAEEREKLKKVQATKAKLESFKERESKLIQELTSLDIKNNKTITRADLLDNKRVLNINDTTGDGIDKSTITLSSDLSLVESQMPTNTHLTPKTYADDAENEIESSTNNNSGMTRIYGLIKVFINNVNDCTIRIQCKLVTGTIEVHNCTNLKIVIEQDATVATLQVDLSKNIYIEFRDAPSGKNVTTTANKLFWGHDADDRIFHAGVTNMNIVVYENNKTVYQLDNIDHIKDGAKAVGNATAEEVQFITSVVNNKLVTEKVATNTAARAMTERQLKEAEAKRQEAAKIALKSAEKMLKITDKDGNPIAIKNDSNNSTIVNQDVHPVVTECETQKARGNEAFGAGEYGQAILLYSLAIDKAAELSTDNDKFPIDLVYSNRSACFLKLGQHEKALQDAQQALDINPDNLKATFRKGLSLHAMKRYYEAMPVLAEAHKREPNNKQIKQALQFAEVRVQQEHRKRMEG